MKLYILHSVIVDTDGQVSIDCRSPYRSLSAAKKEQRSMVSQYQAGLRWDVQVEQCGNFVRVSVPESVEEIQSNIEMFDVDISLDDDFGK